MGTTMGTERVSDAADGSTIPILYFEVQKGGARRKRFKVCMSEW